MELEVYNIKGEKTARKVTLADEIYGVEPNDHVIYLDVKRYMAHKRQGTHSAKERSQLSGSRRKIKRQKGLGTARSGDIKSPIFRGGGRVFGPKPHKYHVRLNHKMKVLARKSALTYKMKDQQITVLEDFSLEKPQTKQYVEILNNLNVRDQKTLLVVNQYDRNLYLSLRNVQNAGMILAADLNTYEVLKAHKLLITESSVATIDGILNHNTKTKTQ